LVLLQLAVKATIILMTPTFCEEVVVWNIHWNTHLKEGHKAVVMNTPIQRAIMVVVRDGVTS